MAIIIEGSTPCRMCGKVIESGQAVVAFPAFVSNSLDPIIMFSDAAFHAQCFRDHPLAETAMARVTEVVERTGPGHRYCHVCNREITHPDDYVNLGYLADNPADTLYQYNYAQFHHACVSRWPELQDVCNQLRALRDSGRWGGPGLNNVIAILADCDNRGARSPTREQVRR